MNEIPTVVEFLEMLSGPAGWAILGVFFSTIFEKWMWFTEQESQIKQIIVVASSVVVSMLSYVLLNHVPAEVMQAIAPYFIILYGIIGTWTSSQVMHVFNRGAELTITEQYDVPSDTEI